MLTGLLFYFLVMAVPSFSVVKWTYVAIANLHPLEGWQTAILQIWYPSYIILFAIYGGRDWFHPLALPFLPFTFANDFLNHPQLIGIPFVVAASVLALLAVLLPSEKWKKRAFAPLMATCLFWFIVYQTASVMVSADQDRAIALLQPDCVSKQGLWHSIIIADREFQSDHHIHAFKDEAVFNWSFERADFYQLHQSVARNTAVDGFRRCYGIEPSWPGDSDELTGLPATD
jgi:hypothetical protein